MKELITKFEFYELLLTDSNNYFYCAPGITEEVGEVLIRIAEQNRFIFIICDMDLQNDYRGMNDIKHLKKLFQNPKVKIKNSKGINVSFISDLKELNYFVFPVSKIFKDEPEGYNAVAFDGLLALKLFTQFFPEMVSDNSNYFLEQFERQKTNQINEIEKTEETLIENLQVDLNVEPISIEEIEEIERQVEKYPPETPDLMRKVNLINTYIQVVDLKFEGANWQSKRVTIPQKLIPYKSEELKKNLDSKLRLFSKDDENDSLNEFNEFKSKIDDIRKEFLFRSKLRDKNIIKTNEKEEFKKRINDLIAEVGEFKDKLFSLVNSQIINSKSKIREELVEFYKNNPDDEMKQFKASFTEVVDEVVDNLMGRIHFPRVSEIIGELKLSFSFLNFTSEDYDDEVFLTELAGWDKLSNEEYKRLFDKEKALLVQKK